MFDKRYVMIRLLYSHYIIDMKFYLSIDGKYRIHKSLDLSLKSFIILRLEIIFNFFYYFIFGFKLCCMQVRALIIPMIYVT